MTIYLGIDIDYSRDQKLSDHAQTLLREAYMTPEEKSPQEAYARAAVAWSGGDMELAQRLYDGVSNNWFMFSSPVLSNAPFVDWTDKHNPKIKKVNKGLPISCFLSYIQDTVKGLVDHTTETRWLSVLGGGVGGHWSAVRSASDVSPGTIPFLHTIDADMLAWKQGKCYTPDTEILTETGWKFFPELKSVDNVAVFDPVTKKITFEQPFEVVKEEHTGPMVFFNGPNVNLVVTPNHSMVIERGDIDDEGFVGFTGKLEKVRADALDPDSIWRFHLANGKHEDNDNIIIGTTWYEGFVYCAVVRTGMIVVRRQGGEDYKTGVVCGNTRKGSYAAYMDLSHPDTLEFIKMRVPVGGGDHNRLCLNLNHAVNIPDAFMEAVRSNGQWSFVDPNDGKVRETVPARQLWETLLEIRYRTGEPYLNFIDTANRALPQEMKDAGLFLRGSNLCNEIHQPTNDERTAVCCLASPNVELFDEWKTSTLIEDMTTMLDNIITYFVDNAPPELAKAVFAASQERSIGIGQMGFHSLLQRRGIPFESEEARELNIEVAKFIDRATSEQSLKLGRERGPAPDVAKSGYRNAMRTAIAPNANSASLVNTSPSIEPWKSNGFVGRDRVGTHLKKNVYLEAVLERYGQNTQEVWDDIISKGGSVQHLDFLTHREKQTFKTAIEIDMSWVVRHAADRQPYVTQGQSVNLFFPPNANKNYLNKVHWQAWEQGLKGLYYCRTESSKKAEVVNEKVERVALKDGDHLPSESASTADECLACHA